MRLHGFKAVIVILTACILTIASSSVAQEDDKGKKVLILSAIENEQTHELAKDVLRIAYERIGITVRFDDLPAQRALEWADMGKTDGDVARIDGTEKKYSNLIKIPIPVILFKGVAFTRKINQPIGSWGDLKSLVVGIIGGIRYSEIGTENLDRVLAKDMTHLFTLLVNDRIDVGIAVLDAGKIEIQKNFRSAGIHVIGRPLHISPLFHFIHTRHQALVPKLEAVLTEMEKTGELFTINEKSLERMMAQ